MEQLSQKMELLQLEQEEQSLKKKEEQVAEQLNDLKQKLDDLLLEKDGIDEMTAGVDKQLKECGEKNQDRNRTGDGVDDNYLVIKHEFDQVSSDREKILEKKKINEKKMEDMNNDFEMIVYERNKIRAEDEEIEKRCKRMRKEFDTINQKSPQDLPESFIDQLEKIRVAKEDILKDDKEIDEENTQLWAEAHSVKDQMFAISRKHALLDEDNKEIEKLFNEITSERNKLIERDNLLNGRYQVIHENIQDVCDQRIEVKVQMDNLVKERKIDEPLGVKDALMQEDLDLAVK